MENANISVFGFLAVASFVAISSAIVADDLNTAPVSIAQSPAVTPTDTRYGPFNCLDHRSTYGAGPYPEPFIVDDTVLEVNEARLDWQHSETPDGQDDVVKAEIEKSFGQVTLEIEAPYELEHVTTPPKSNTEGFNNIDVGAR